MRKQHYTSNSEEKFTYFGIKNLVLVFLPIAENE